MRRGLCGVALLMSLLAACGPPVDHSLAIPSAAAEASAVPAPAVAPSQNAAAPLVVALFFNVRQGHPFADVAVRRAIASCLEPDSLVSAIAPLAPPGAHRSVHLLPTTVADDGMVGIEPPAVDPDAARAVLEGAGWSVGQDGVAVREGVRLEVLEVAPVGPAYRWASLQAAEAGLRRCGVDTARPQDLAGGVPVTTERAGLGLMAWPATREGLASALGSAGAGDGNLTDVTNWSGWADQETDRLLGLLQAATTTADAATALAELERRISDGLPVIPLWFEP